MEGKEYEFDIFNDDLSYINDLYNVLPFNNFDDNKGNDDFFDLLNIDFSNSWDIKNSGTSEQLIDKLNKMEQNYNNIITNEIVSSPATSNLTFNQLDPKKKICDLESNLILAENTLPGLIISMMHKENSPVSLNFILTHVYPKFDELRRANGSKYSGDINKVLKSALSSSGIFFKTVDEKFFFKEKEAVEFIIRVSEKVLTKKLEKEKKESKSISSTSTGKSKKQKNILSGEINYKICKVYGIIDKLLIECRESKELKNPFKVVFILILGHQFRHRVTPKNRRPK
jgi:hypothetical protein